MVLVRVLVKTSIQVFKEEVDDLSIQAQSCVQRTHSFWGYPQAELVGELDCLSLRFLGFCARLDFDIIIKILTLDTLLVNDSELRVGGLCVLLFLRHHSNCKSALFVAVFPRTLQPLDYTLGILNNHGVCVSSVSMPLVVLESADKSLKPNL